MTKRFDLDLASLEINDLDAALLADLDDTGFQAFAAQEFDGDLLTGNVIQIAWHADAGRAGLVYVGSGSSGQSAWTDASSPADALRRYLDDDMRP